MECCKWSATIGTHNDDECKFVVTTLAQAKYLIYYLLSYCNYCAKKHIYSSWIIRILIDASFVVELWIICTTHQKLLIIQLLYILDIESTNEK